MPTPPPGGEIRARTRVERAPQKARREGDGRGVFRRFKRSDDRLLADAERLDDAAVGPEILGLQVVEQATALADHHEKATAGVVILQVSLEVLRQVRDALGEEGDLDLGRTGVLLVLLELPDHFLFRLFRDPVSIFTSLYPDAYLPRTVL